MIKVFIIEDEPLVRRDLVLLTTWEELGCICIGEAADGKEGVQLCRELKPDLVITDIRMPIMDGLEMIDVLSELSQITPEENACEFIILSGYSDFEYARQAMRQGVQEYLVKPIDDEELKAAVLRVKDRILINRNMNSLQNNRDKNSGGSMLVFFREYELGQRESANAKHVQAAIDLIQSYYIGGITVDDVAEKLSISSGHLSRIFKQETSYTFVDYLTYFRVKKAAELLKDPTVKIYEAADMVGYTDARYFSQIFRRITGLTPREFREGK